MRARVIGLGQSAAGDDGVGVAVARALRQRGVADDALPQTPRPGVAYIKVEPQRIISWDYSREADAH